MIHDKMCPDPDGRNHDKDCECEFIAAVRADERAEVLDAAEAAVADVGFNFPFDIRDVPAYGKQVFAAIRGLREEK